VFFMESALIFLPAALSGKRVACAAADVAIS
jgi:hypothetical protein